MAYTPIDNPGENFNTILYTGNSSTQSITGVGFQPDWVWCKSRSGADNHAIFDSVRGGQKQLRSNTSGAELTRTNAISSFNSDGWSMGSQPEMNSSGTTYASWNWKAGTSFTNDASATGIGTIDSTGSANDTSGFSIVSYTGNGTSGATVKHGLSTALDVIFIKDRDEAEAWQTYHRPLGATHHLSLNTTASAQDNVSRFNDVDPTSSVFTLGNNDTVNKNTVKYIAYCFAPKQGYSRVGTFLSNNTTDNAWVYCGFKPALVLLKSTTSTNDWMIFDNKRDPFNVTQHKIYPDLSNAEATNENDLDFLSTGFKLRNNHGANTFIFMAFAEQPFVTSTGVPATAR